jgi:hypothetical protein
MKKVAVAVALFVLSPVAGALAGGGSTLAGYGGSAGTVQGTVQKTGSLPFTGMDLSLVAVIAGALVVAGLLLRRASNT